MLKSVLLVLALATALACAHNLDSASYYDVQDVMFNEIEECDYGVESDGEMYGVELKCQVLSEKCSQLKVILESGETGTIVGCLENNDQCATIDNDRTCPTEKIDSKHELALRNIFFKLGKTEEQASISAEVSTSSDVFCAYSNSRACKEEGIHLNYFTDQTASEYDGNNNVRISDGTVKGIHETHSDDHTQPATKRVTPAPPDPGYIYIISEGTMYYKVGKSKDPNVRIKNLQTGNPRSLQIFRQWWVTDMAGAEDKVKRSPELVHRYKINLGGGTEWYEVKRTRSFVNYVKKAIKQYLGSRWQ